MISGEINSTQAIDGGHQYNSNWNLSTQIHKTLIVISAVADSVP